MSDPMSDETRRFLGIVDKTRELMHGTPSEQARAIDFIETLRDRGGPLETMAAMLEACALLPPHRMRH